MVRGLGSLERVSELKSQRFRPHRESCLHPQERVPNSRDESSVIIGGLGGSVPDSKEEYLSPTEKSPNPKVGPRFYKQGF